MKGYSSLSRRQAYNDAIEDSALRRVYALRAANAAPEVLAAAEADLARLTALADAKMRSRAALVGLAFPTPLTVAYAERNQVKALGARWNAQTRKWEAPANRPLAPFNQWLPDSLKQQ